MCSIFHSVDDAAKLFDDNENLKVNTADVKKYI